MLPPAPPAFSTITVWPSGPRMRSAMMRAAVSVDPPGGKGTSSVMGRAGKVVCAPAVTADNASATAAMSFFISFRLYVGFLDHASPLRRIGFDPLHGLGWREDVRSEERRVGS